MPSNKDRLYHWALIVGPKVKAEDGMGVRYHAKERPRLGGGSEWFFEERECPLAPTSMLLVRIMVGKANQAGTVSFWVKEALDTLKVNSKALGTSVVEWEKLLFIRRHEKVAMRKLREAFGGRRRKGQVSSSEGIDPPKSSQPSAEDPFTLNFPDGVEVLYDCPNATVDICFVHGLTGDRTTTWTAQGQSDPWPKTLLPSKLSTARILTYGYDAYVVRRSVAGSNRLIDHATNLLYDLTTDRDLHNAASRPIIFVTHSLGGLVCKKAILRSRNNPDAHLRNIFHCTKGVIFIGTPHKGSWMADWAKISAGALGLVKSTNKSLLEILRTDNQFLEAIQVDFWCMIRELRENGRRLEVICFFEELPLPVVGKVVSKNSATLEGYNLVSIHANHRDMCLKSLWPTNPENEKIQIQQTKGGLLEDVYNWVLENPEFRRWRDDQKARLLWIRGDPGKGKTMLVCGIIDELKKSVIPSNLLSFFFCQAADSRINNATAILRCLIRQLVDQQPSLIAHVRKQYDQYEDTNSWYTMSQIFTDILEDRAMQSTFLVIDGLDECQAGLAELLNKIEQNWSSYSQVKWLVSSRNWHSIEGRLGSAEQLSLDLNAESVSTAVGLYINHKASELARLKKYKSQTQNAVQQHLTTNANGTFLWVALVCQYLERVEWDPLTKMKTFPPGLDSLYQRMVQVICESEDYELCREILGLMAAAYRPITLQELASFSKILIEHSNDDESLERAINLCGSFLTTREGTVYFIHQSAKEFLTGKASDELFPAGIELIHHTIFSRSLSNMGLALRRDVYSLRNPGFPIDKVKRPKPDPLGAVRYSCIYWVNHLQDARQIAAVKQSQVCDKISGFLREKYIYWLEALSLLDSMSQGVRSMSKLEDLVQKREPQDSTLINLVCDAHRFIRYWKSGIENSPLQVYNSALLLSPARSLIRQLFEYEQPDWYLTRPAAEDNWSACLQTLEGHSMSVSSVVFSHNSKLVASASDDRTVKIWDATSGYCLQTLEGHSMAVSSVMFSHDSKLVASASDDRTVKIWDSTSGHCLETLEGHSISVRSVVFSHDSKLLASSSDDRTVKIWDAASGHCLETLKGHCSPVRSVVFSHDSKLVASASHDKTVRIWDATSGYCLQTLEGHSMPVSSVMFSHDSKLVASASDDRTVKIWDAIRGHCLETLEGHSISVRSVVFSHDSKLVASASDDRTVKIWDATSGHCLQTLKGHSGSVRSAVFSQDSKLVASTSHDKTVKIWDAASGNYLETLKGHSMLVRSVVFSHDYKLVASASHDRTVKIWDAASGHCLQTLEGHSDWVISLIFSRDSKLIASASDDQTVRIWDAGSGHCLQTLEGHSIPVSSVIFSHDSKLVTSVSHDKSAKIWDAASGHYLQTLEGYSDWDISVVFSHDSKLVASASHDKTVKIWDAASGHCLQTLEGHSGWVRSVVFSHDSRLVASASHDKSAKMWDAASGRCLQTLEGHSDWVSSVVFSHDSKLVASTSHDRTVKIWDAASGHCLQMLKGHSGWVSSVVFSQDTKLVASSSDDQTVRIWDTANAHCLLMVNTGRINRVKSFDLTDSYLELDRGTIHLSSISLAMPAEPSPKAPKFQGCSISSDRMWITWNEEKLLWLPPEYRPHAFDVTLSDICIGCASGRVLLFHIDRRQLSHLITNR
ncbi:hypothetical protein CNMCM6457_001372 [Aspergillus fumigatiaffinis]|nr:hypothetical protein CNMCM6457_001372 [Aspergillus fumigatiaffinis]